MPFKSKAQRRKFAQLLIEGKISNETFEEWNREREPRNSLNGSEAVRQRERGRKPNVAEERCKRAVGE